MQVDKFPNGFFPRYIDRPRLIGIFEIDEFMIVFGMIFIVIFGSLAFPDLASGIVMPVSIIGGLLSGVFYKKFKKNRPNGYTIQMLYKKGIYHPDEGPSTTISYPYLKDKRSVPYGFTKELIN